MSELTYAQEAVLNGDEFDVDELFAGLVRMGALGDVANPTLYLPPASEQRQGECKSSWLNILEAVARRLSCANGIYVCRDSTDGEDEFSVTPGVIQHQGRWMTYAGEVNVGPLSRGATNYIWLDVSGSAPAAAFGAAWPASNPNVIRLATITMPASGYWLGTIGGNLSRVSGGQATVAALSSPGVFKATLLHGSSSPLVIGRVAAGCAIGRRRCDVTAAFNGSSPTLEVGDADDTDRLTASGEFDLATPDLYEFSRMTRYETETEIIGTYVADGSDAGEAVIYLEVLP